MKTEVMVFSPGNTCNPFTVNLGFTFKTLCQNWVLKWLVILKSLKYAIVKPFQSKLHPFGTYFQ